MATDPFDLPCFDINLDERPRLRWRAVATAYAEQLGQLAAWQEAVAAGTYIQKKASGAGGRRRAKRSRKQAKIDAAEYEIARFASAEAKALLEQLSKSGPPAMKEVVEELQGVADAAGVEMHTLAMLSLQYEAYCACTAVVAPTEDGHLALARTLDWEFPEIKALNIDIRVHRGKRLLYTATTWAGFIGILTAQRPERYALAVNFRERGPDEEKAEQAWSGCGGDMPLPVGLAMRLALERCSTYAEFVEDVATMPLMAPCYCMVASASREGVQITRCGGTLGELQRRSVGDGTTYLVQANMDHWDRDPENDTQESLLRCKRAEEMLHASLARGCITDVDLWALLSEPPIYDPDTTLYCSVMNPAVGLFRSVMFLPEAIEEKAPKGRSQRKAGKKRQR